MSVSAISAQSALAIKSLVDMRAKLDDLQRQLSTGQKSDTYAGLGLDRGVTVSLNAQLSAIGGYNNTITNVSTRISVAETALGRMFDIGNSLKSAMAQAGYGVNGTGASTVQNTAQTSLDELLSLLNTQVGDHYLFSGRATDQPAVQPLDEILNGDGSRAGLKQIISERNQADQGVGGLGRLTVTAPTATSVNVADDVSPFGFKMASAASTLSGATVSGPTGSPASLSVGFTGVPSAGETFTLRLTLPDGTSENVTLTATSSATPGANEFTAGPTAAATAASFRTALTGAIGTLAGTSLTAASAVAASDDFFDADSSNPPQRVAGPPFNTATAMTAGSASDTVIWYTGETGTDPARATATARIDQSLVVAYGVRGNEEGLRNLVKNVATLAAVTVSSTDPNAADLSQALNQRLTASLNGSAGTQSVNDIAAELAGAQTSINAAKNRHQQTAATLGDFLQQVTGVTNEEVGAQILTLQTRMQASMQTTAMLFQTSLVNYLK